MFLKSIIPLYSRNSPSISQTSKSGPWEFWDLLQVTQSVVGSRPSNISIIVPSLWLHSTRKFVWWQLSNQTFSFETCICSVNIYWILDSFWDEIIMVLSQLEQIKQKNIKIKTMSIFLYLEVFIQPTFIEYLLYANISAGCGNQKIIRHPLWHWGIHLIIKDEKLYSDKWYSSTWKHRRKMT